MFDTDEIHFRLMFYKGLDNRMGDLITLVKPIDEDLYNKLIGNWIAQGNAFHMLMNSIKEEKDES